MYKCFVTKTHYFLHASFCTVCFCHSSWHSWPAYTWACKTSNLLVFMIAPHRQTFPVCSFIHYLSSLSLSLFWILLSKFLWCAACPLVTQADIIAYYSAVSAYLAISIETKHGLILVMMKIICGGESSHALGHGSGTPEYSTTSMIQFTVAWW